MLCKLLEKGANPNEKFSIQEWKRIKDENYVGNFKF